MKIATLVVSPFTNDFSVACNAILIVFYLCLTKLNSGLSNPATALSAAL